MDAALTRQIIDRIKTEILAWYDASLALSSNSGVLSYTIDTGQTKQTVTRNDLSMIEAKISSLENKCAVYETRLTGRGTTNARPGW